MGVLSRAQTVTRQVGQPGMSWVDGDRLRHYVSGEQTRLIVAISGGTDRALIEADGVLDEAGGELLRRTVQSLAPMRLQQIGLDLSDVRGADLAGVRALEDLREIVELAGAEFTIYNADSARYPFDWHSIALASDPIAGYEDDVPTAGGAP
jgi:anti-anti-sigma regulatory factor